MSQLAGWGLCKFTHDGDVRHRYVWGGAAPALLRGLRGYNVSHRHFLCVVPGCDDAGAGGDHQHCMVGICMEARPRARTEMHAATARVVEVSSKAKTVYDMLSYHDTLRRHP